MKNNKNELALPKKDTSTGQPSSFRRGLPFLPQRRRPRISEVLPSAAQDTAHMAPFIGAADLDC